MDVNQLIAFERVVREGSFSKAAWSLGVSQPTVSARIQALETMVGGLLFRRGRPVGFWIAGTAEHWCVAFVDWKFAWSGTLEVSYAVPRD
jgi:Bacterial regulatory helix-turn-helix protein, lysR family